MSELLVILGVGLALLIALRMSYALWRWKCPRCGVRALRYVGTAAIYLPPGEGPFDIRFEAARCAACGRPAYRRSTFGAPWEPEMRADPAGPSLPEPPAVGAQEIVFDEAAPQEHQRAPRE